MDSNYSIQQGISGCLSFTYLESGLSDLLHTGLLRGTQGSAVSNV